MHFRGGPVFLTQSPASLSPTGGLVGQLYFGRRYAACVYYARGCCGAGGGARGIVCVQRGAHRDTRGGRATRRPTAAAERCFGRGRVSCCGQWVGLVLEARTILEQQHRVSG